MYRLISTLFLIASASVLVATAEAQENDSRWYVAGLASYVDDDKNRDADDGLDGGQLAIGIPFRGAWSLEFFGLYNKFNAQGFDADQEQKGLGAGVVRWFNQGGWLSPYAGVATGYSKTTRVSGQDESAPMTSGALGMLIGFADSSFAWRSEVRYRRTLEDISLTDLYYSSGLQWSPGRRSDGGRDGVTRIRNDSDGDGVADDFDLCPDTSNMVVDARGCPEADNDRDGVVNRLDRCPRTPFNIKVNSRGCPPDSDRDGVIDALDACRDSAWEAVVDERGCALGKDADGDGVADDVDECKNTSAAEQVDARGCALKKPDVRASVLKGVAFASNSSQLLASSRAVLDETAQMLRANPSLRAEIAGHTDSQGEAAYNQWLSQRRAEAVRSYLVSRGIAANRLVARGYGESNPVADNASAAGRALNRRVELRPID